jgi:5-methylcytosine-specific restriction endonuclease McrA
LKRAPLRRARKPLAVRRRLRAKKRLTKRQRLAAKGKRALEEADALAAFRVSVLDRAGGVCERCAVPSRYLHAHHLRPRSRGGEHHQNNGAALCWLCHRIVHDHAAKDWKEWIR